MDRLAEILERWRGTPWVDGQCVPGHGCNSWGFASSVLAELRGLEPPSALSCHAVAGLSARARTRIVAAMVDYFSPCLRLASHDEVERGDLVLSPGAGLGHAAIASGPQEMWTVSPGGVVEPRPMIVRSAAWRMLEVEP